MNSETLDKLRAKANATKGQEHETFAYKVEELEFRLYGRWTWWRLLAMTIKAKEGM